ncbi:MAG: fasciclin domain-containing protein [Chitinophagaceae bacterium]|nr:MAG: fasciclin domain-containing protein [Chitinophagaceae bacterium]
MKFYKLLFRSAAMLALSGTLVLTSCSDDDDPGPVPNPTVVGVAQSDTNFSILVAALQKANLVTTLSNTSANFTVFAPTNTAFRNAGITAAAIAAFTPAEVNNVLTPILTYHVLGAKVNASGVPVSDTVKTVNGKNIFASKNPNGVFVNGVKVTSADINASNGVVHVIGSVLMPPTKSIAQIVTDDPTRFSLLLTAVVRAGLAGTLSGPGKFTVFAPVNSGFPAALDTDAEINAAPVATVAGIVGSHAFATNIFAGDLTAGNTGATVNPATTLTIGLTPPTVKITGSGMAASNITTTNIVATNGVIHIIDKVLQ